MNTPLGELLGIKYPIFQGGMAWISESNLAAAVSRAGGLGVISAMNAGADYLRGEIAKCRAALDGQPFAVNIMLMSPHVNEVAQVVIDEKIPVVITGAGMPDKYMPGWIEAGIKVIPVVASVALARRVERLGATAVVAEGCESGGHVGETTTMSLLPQVCDAVSLPVVGAGGIADGRGLAAAFMLGAQGVQCGTCFLTAYECTVHPNYKKKIMAAKDIDTIVTGKTLGHPVRSLKNSFSRTFAAMEADPSVTPQQIEEYGVGSLRLAAMEGDEKKGSFMSGQIAGLVKEEKSAKEIIEGMFSQAEALMGAGAPWAK